MNLKELRERLKEGPGQPKGQSSKDIYWRNGLLHVWVFALFVLLLLIPFFLSNYLVQFNETRTTEGIGLDETPIEGYQWDGVPLTHYSATAKRYYVDSWHISELSVNVVDNDLDITWEVPYDFFTQDELLVFYDFGPSEMLDREQLTWGIKVTLQDPSWEPSNIRYGLGLHDETGMLAIIQGMPVKEPFTASGTDYHHEHEFSFLISELLAFKETYPGAKFFFYCLVEGVNHYALGDLDTILIDNSLWEVKVVGGNLKAYAWGYHLLTGPGFVLMGILMLPNVDLGVIFGFFKKKESRKVEAKNLSIQKRFYKKWMER